MSESLKKEEKALLYLLWQAIGCKDGRQKKLRANMDGLDWEKLFRIAESHAVLPLLYDVLKAYRNRGLSEALFKKAEKISRITVQSNYRLLFLTKYLTELLKEHGITAITLKGAVTAALYPVPELRKSGDVDLLITNTADYERACRLLLQQGFTRPDRQLTLHHTELRHPEGIVVEVHGMLSEPFASSEMNRYLDRLLTEFGEHAVENTSWGLCLYEPEEAYHAFYLILHMLQHFLRAGFGLKNICDWVVFWNRETTPEVQEKFLHLIKESGTEGFVQGLSAACIKYLGLIEDHMAFLDFKTEWVSDENIEEFLQEIFQAGEFGKEESDRMVAMRGTGIRAYVQEFHHQMHLNYPKAGKIFLIWPVLWVLTLQRFIKNNRKLRGVSTRKILKKAGRRSALVKRMKLFGKSEKNSCIRR